MNPLESSCPEEQSVHTPLLDGEPEVTLPVNILQPSIKHYDDIFRDQCGDDIPLGGTAGTLINQP